MSYINFDKNQLVNLEYSLKRELLRSNRAGSYACTTIMGCNTRKYHGLLVTPQPAIDGENHVLLSALDITVIQNGEGSSISVFINMHAGFIFQKVINISVISHSSLCQSSPFV